MMNTVRAESLRVSLIQSSIAWEEREANLQRFGRLLKRACGKTDLAILPETFTTGFSMEVERLADTMEGTTLSTVRKWASDFQLAIIGSFIARVDEHYFNRAFLVTPTGETHFYDKRHLFRMAGEDRRFTEGEKQTIVPYKGWNICLQVCYDLRFPVWSRNVANAYDLLVYVANWPEARRSAWKTLLPARAVENLVFVCGVNRVGIDGKGIAYGGDSAIYSPKGEKLADAGKRDGAVRTCTLAYSELDRLRTKFPAWKDADRFSLHI